MTFNTIQLNKDYNSLETLLGLGVCLHDFFFLQVLTWKVLNCYASKEILFCNYFCTPIKQIKTCVID